MKNPVVVAAALVVALIAGYGVSLLIERPLTGPCNGTNEHCIKVKISNNTISVDVDDLYVSAPNSPEHKIYWLMDPQTSPYTFPAGGISFVTPPLPPTNEFHDCKVHPGSNGQIFVCKDANSQPGKYKYTINVSGPQPVPALDPTVRNG